MSFLKPFAGISRGAPPHRRFGINPPAKSLVEATGRHAASAVFGPFNNRLALAEGCHAATVPAIATLRAWCRPPAVPRLVSAGVVDAIQRRAHRAGAHFRKEGAEVLPPLFAHRDAAPPVSGKILGGRTVTADLRRRPGTILRRKRPGPRRPVSGPSLRERTLSLPVGASARPGVARSQIAGLDSDRLAAVTATDAGAPRLAASIHEGLEATCHGQASEASTDGRITSWLHRQILRHLYVGA